MTPSPPKKFSVVLLELVETVITGGRLIPSSATAGTEPTEMETSLRLGHVASKDIVEISVSECEPEHTFVVCMTSRISRRVIFCVLRNRCPTRPLETTCANPRKSTERMSIATMASITDTPYCFLDRVYLAKSVVC